MPKTEDERAEIIPTELEHILVETSQRINYKINNSPAFAPRRLTYLLVEELALLFEVLVVRISASSSLSNSADSGKKHFSSHDMNISEADYHQIRAMFSQGELQAAANKNKVVIQQCQPLINTNNHTIRFIDSALILAIRDSISSTPMVIAEIYYASDGRDVPNRSEGATRLLRAVALVPAVQERLFNILSGAVRNGLEMVSTSHQTSKSPASDWVRASKLAFLRKWAPDKGQKISDEFREAYAHHFESINVIFGSLHDRFTDLPDFFFSFRRSEDDHLSFFPTAKQLGDLQISGMTIGDFKHLLTYPYKEGGLNGYVLNTRHPIYLPNQHEDERFAALQSEARFDDSYIKYDPERQK